MVITWKEMHRISSPFFSPLFFRSHPASIAFTIVVALAVRFVLLRRASSFSPKRQFYDIAKNALSIDMHAPHRNLLAPNGPAAFYGALT
jgi:hypothetical protein